MCVVCKLWPMLYNDQVCLKWYMKYSSKYHTSKVSPFAFVTTLNYAHNVDRVVHVDACVYSREHWYCKLVRFSTNEHGANEHGAKTLVMEQKKLVAEMTVIFQYDQSMSWTMLHCNNIVFICLWDPIFPYHSYECIRESWQRYVSIPLKLPGVSLFAFSDDRHWP